MIRAACILWLVVMLATRTFAQAPSVAARGGAMHLTAPAFHFLTGTTLDQLRDGRSVRMEFELAVLPGPGGTAAQRARERITVSYDLWEERFAATTDAPVRSARHLTLADAEAWCLDQLTVPLRALERERRAPFWIRLTYRIDRSDADSDDSGGGFTLRGLIDRMSRRTSADEVSATTELGPFQLAN